MALQVGGSRQLHWRIREIRLHYGDGILMTCTEAYATAQEYATFWGLECREIEAIEAINSALAAAAGNIHAALAAVAACDCTLAGWAVGFLAKLNMIEAGAINTRGCAQPQYMDSAEREMWLTWSNEQLRIIRSGEIDLCAGATGSTWPSFGWAEQTHTEFAAEQIVLNRRLRDLA